VPFFIGFAIEEGRFFYRCSIKILLPYHRFALIKEEHQGETIEPLDEYYDLKKDNA